MCRVLYRQLFVLLCCVALWSWVGLNCGVENPSSEEPSSEQNTKVEKALEEPTSKPEQEFVVVKESKPVEESIVEDAGIMEAGREPVPEFEPKDLPIPPLQMTLSPGKGVIASDACSVIVKFSDIPHITSAKAWFHRKGDHVDIQATFSFDITTGREARLCPMFPLRPSSDYSLILDVALDSNPERRFRQTVNFQTVDTYAQSTFHFKDKFFGFFVRKILSPEGLKSWISAKSYPITWILKVTEQDKAKQGSISLLAVQAKSGDYPPKTPFVVDNEITPIGFSLKGEFIGRWFSFEMDELLVPFPYLRFGFRAKRARIVGLVSADGKSIEFLGLTTHVLTTWYDKRFGGGVTKSCEEQFKDDCFRDKDDGKVVQLSGQATALSRPSWPLAAWILSPRYTTTNVAKQSTVTGYVTKTVKAEQVKVRLLLCSEGSDLDDPCVRAKYNTISVPAKPVVASDGHTVTVVLPALAPSGWYRFELIVSLDKSPSYTTFTVFQTGP